MLLRPLLLFPLLLTAAPIDAEAYFKEGRDLARQCADYENERDPASSTNSNFCLAYIIGVHDALDANVFCGEGPDTTPGQLVPIVIQYMRAHPDKLNAPADTVVREAIEKAFPSSFPKPSTATGD